MRRAAAGDGLGPAGSQLTFIDGDDHTSVSWADLHVQATAMAAALQANGVAAGDHVAILGPTTRDLVTAIQATWLVGGCVVMLPLPMRMASIDAFIDQTRQRFANSDCTIVLMDPQFSEFVEPVDGDPPFVLLSDLDGDAADFEQPDVDPEAMAVLQFTSGSTSDPKGVMLSHRAICNNIDGAVGSAQVSNDDVAVSWLPLYHDMGLIGLLTIPMSTGIPLVLGAPQDFMARPLRWLKWISDFGGTMTAGPNFAWVLATRALRRADDLDLSSLRLALSGAEPVDAESFRGFVAAGEPFGLDPGSLFPAFGMAEVCIAGTFPPRGRGLTTDIVDQHVLEHERYARPAAAGDNHARELVCLGKAVPGLEIKVIDPDTQRRCREREIGELLIRGNSLTSGYYRRPEATSESIVDGWLHTGDLAYLIDDGELVMCGRIKDLIIIGGRNIYPQDVEKVAGAVEGVRAGNVIVFGQDGRHGKQHLVVVAETREDETDELRKRVVMEINRHIGVPPRDVVLVPPGTVPKTSSGKLQRSACRLMFERGELRPSSAPR
jgi:fatty-acyl-CoA synthase